MSWIFSAVVEAAACSEGVIDIAELTLKTKTLPEPLRRLIAAEEVRVREGDNGAIRLIPVKVSEKPVNNCPLLGLYADGKLTVDGYLERKRIEKELDR